MKEQIDVLLATYNGEKYIREQIDSILNQTYKNIRLIISDDCSKDSTSQILSEYKEKDERIVVYLQKENLGVVKNIEFLLSKVESEFYMLSDQDDFWMPEKIEKSYDKIVNENADLVFGDLEVVDNNLNRIAPSFNDYMLLTRKINKYISSYKVNYLYNCVTGCTIISKKNLINKIIPFPINSKKVIHDYWIGLMIGLNGKLAYMSEKYIKYRQHENNQVGTKKLSHGFSKVGQVRELFIDVKLGIFETYVKNNDRFPSEIQMLNEEALGYFKMLEKKKNINFKGWKTFYKLYKTETFKYFLENFLILNMPKLVEIPFKIRYFILKILKRR